MENEKESIDKLLMVILEQRKKYKLENSLDKYPNIKKLVNLNETYGTIKIK